MQRFTDLKVWQRAHAMVLEIYRITGAFPAEERYGLVSQLRRAAVSIPANIAEGSKREGRADYARFLNLAESSLAEAQYMIMLARDLSYLAIDTSESILSESDEIARMLSALRAKVANQ